MKDKKDKKDADAPIRDLRAVPAFNQDAYEGAVRLLRVPDTYTTERLNQEIVNIFKEHEAKAQAGEIGVGRIPSRIQQMLVNRIRARLMTRLWAVEMGDVNPSGWGEQLSYRFHDSHLPKVYRIGAPGGNWHEVVVNPDQVVTLPEPIFYTTPEMMIARFDPRFPGRYRQDLAEAADYAALAIENQIDTDCMDAVNSQIVLAADGDLLSAGMTFIHPKVFGAPTYNALDLSSHGAVNMEVYKEIVMHTLKLDRRLERLYMHPDTIASMWDSVYDGTNFPRWPEDRRSEMMDRGAPAWNSFFGIDVPTPTPTMAIDVTGDEKYFYGLLTPNDDLAPRGAFWMFTYPEPYAVDGGGQAYFYDRLEYIGHKTLPGRLYDVYVLQKAVNIAYTNYQRPNLIRVRYD